MVTKIDELKYYREVKERNDDKLFEQKNVHELKDNFIERTEVRSLLTRIATVIGEDASYWINIDDSWRNFTDKFEQGAIISMRIRPEDSEDAESVRGKLQRVFHKPAIRTVSSYDGEVYYSFDVTFARKETEEGEVYLVPGTLTVSISKASLAETCEVVKVTEEVSRYEIVCSEGTKEVVNE